MTYVAPGVITQRSGGESGGAFPPVPPPVDVPLVPGQPTNLVARLAAGSNTTVELSWSLPDGLAEALELAVNDVVLFTITPALDVTLTGQPLDTVQSWSIRAINGSGSSAWTSSLPITTGPAAPVLSLGGTMAPPAITSPLNVASEYGEDVNYTITATENPTSFSANGLPGELSLAGAVISGLIFPDQITVDYGDTVLRNSYGAADWRPGVQTLYRYTAPDKPTTEALYTNVRNTMGVAVGDDLHYCVAHFYFADPAQNQVAVATAKLANPSDVGSYNPSSFLWMSWGRSAPLRRVAGSYDAWDYSPWPDAGSTHDPVASVIGVSGAPTPVIIGASNAAGSTTESLVFSMTAALGPHITSAAEVPFDLGVPFSFQVTVDNGPATFSAADLPAGLSISPAGLISGTPSAGSSLATITATTANGVDHQQVQFTQNVVEGVLVGTSEGAIWWRGAAKTPITVPVTAGKAVVVAFDPITRRAFIVERDGSGLWYSDDAGDTWTRVAATGAPTGVDFVAVIRPDGSTPRLLAVVNADQSSAFTTDDLANWTTQASPALDSLMSDGITATAAGQAGGNAPRAWTTQDGVTWTAFVSPSQGSGAGSGAWTLENGRKLFGLWRWMDSGELYIGNSFDSMSSMHVFSANQAPIGALQLTDGRVVGVADWTGVGSASGTVSFVISAAEVIMVQSAPALQGARRMVFDGARDVLVLIRDDGSVAESVDLSTFTVVGSLGAVSPFGMNAAIFPRVPQAPGLPVITSSLTQAATLGTPFSYQITATQHPTSYAAYNLPPGLSCNTATGEISGTPSAIGDYNISLYAYNATGTGSASLTLAITSGAVAPIITSALSASFTWGEPFSYQITAANLPTSFDAVSVDSSGAYDPAPALALAATAPIWLKSENYTPGSAALWPNSGTLGDLGFGAVGAALASPDAARGVLFPGNRGLRSDIIPAYANTTTFMVFHPLSNAGYMSPMALKWGGSSNPTTQHWAPSFLLNYPATNSITCIGGGGPFSSHYEIRAAGGLPSGAINRNILAAYAYTGDAPTWGSVDGVDRDVSYKPYGSSTGQTNTAGSVVSLSLGYDFLGDNGYFNGYLAEIVVFNRILSLAECETINTYLKNKWGIA